MDFVMRSAVVGLLTLLLLAGGHAPAQVPGPVDPTGLKPGWLNIDGVRYELLLPPNVDVRVQDRWSPDSFIILDHAKPRDYTRLGPFPPDAKELDRAITLATGRTFRYRVGRGGGISSLLLEGRVEIGGRAVGVSCAHFDNKVRVPDFCIAYLQHLKVADLQIPPMAQCDGLEVIAQHSLRRQKRCLPMMRSPVQGFRDCRSCPEMVEVPAGSFVMGSPADEAGREPGEDQGRGEHQVDVTIAKPFAVGRFAVTYAEWEACLYAGGCAGHKALRVLDAGWEWERRHKQPVVGVSWHAAKAYVAWLSKATGKPYRLLSEAEREYVARAGTVTPYWWGTSISTGQANYDGSRSYGDGTEPIWLIQTVPVDTFAPNPWGLYHVHGNVWEWTEDCVNDSNIGNPGDGRPRTTGDCTHRVVRGGAYATQPQALRAATRVGRRADDRSEIVGFRVARALD
jgi:formylglycine-generating enzyme required for sulfatase activity